MTSNHLPPASEEGRVIPFRPRQQVPSGWRWPRQNNRASPVEDLAKYERPESEDEYRHRMKMNVLAVVVTIILMGMGAWLVTTLADIRKNEDCYLSGRRDCTPTPYGPTVVHG